MSKNILKYFLLGLSFIFSFLSWQRVGIEINSSDPSNWLWPIVFFTLFFVSFYLAIILTREKSIIDLATLFCLSLSFIFVLDPWHFVSIIFGFALASSGIWRIRRDMRLNIEISLAKTLGTGKQFLILAFAIVLVSQYFFTVKEIDFQKQVPKFVTNKYSGFITSKIISAINPDYKRISDNEITVDEFILENQKKELEKRNVELFSDQQIENYLGQMTEKIDESHKEEIKNEVKNNLENANIQILDANQKMIMDESRKKISNLVGRELSGQEKISEVFEGIINRKITDYLRPEVNEKTNATLLPTILAVILLLTIIPLGSILNILWVLLSKLIFWIFVKSKLVIINKITELIEVIE